MISHIETITPLTPPDFPGAGEIDTAVFCGKR